MRCGWEGRFIVGQEETDITHTAYTVFDNLDQKEVCASTRHRTLRAAGLAYQVRHTGNMRRVLDSWGRDVTQDAVNAANAAR